MSFLNDGNESDDNVLRINKSYADRYDKWRKDEELQKLKDKYGDAPEDESSTSEEEDEDAVELTDKVEKDFFKTLSCLKEKDPKIYDENIRFFEVNEEGTNTKRVKKKPEETLTMAAYQRKMLIETNGVIEEEAQEFEDMPLVEQEKQIKDSFKHALNNSDSDSEGVGGLFKARVKTKEELAAEEATYKNWLAGLEITVANEEKKDLKGLRDYWNDPKLEEGEKFLRDYILKQRYLEKDSKPAFVHDLSDLEEETIAQQEEFERKFNFRFEEPDQDFIKRYPRTVEQSMRKKDDKRIKQREVLKARKLAERAQKDEELKRLKALKRAQIMEKIKKLQEVTGNEELTFQENDIDGEFNPEEHDKRMSELFNQSFYEEPADEEKPEFPELDEELEIEKWDEWKGKDQEHEENLHCEDAGFVMDCDYDPQSATQQQLIENTKRKKKRRQSKFSVALARPKPVFDPKNSTYEKYLDEYYALNYEDLIGDIPCRFKYRKVVPNNFGLSIEEILSAPDKELNQWASSKKIMRRRPEHVEIYEQKAYQKKASDLKKKMQILPSLYSSTPDEEEEAVLNSVLNVKSDAPLLENIKQSMPINDAKVKKKKSKLKIKEVVDEQAALKVAENENQVASKKKKRKRKASKTKGKSVDKLVHKKKKVDIGSASESKAGAVESKLNLPKNKPAQNRQKFKKKGNLNGKIKNNTEKRRLQKDENPLSSLSDARLKSYGINPKKFKNKLKYGNK